MKTIFEPFRIKITEHLPMNTREERVQRLKDAYFNVFLLDADDCIIDLLTDSGTGAMSTHQWAAMMLGDESYAGSRSWKHFENTVRDITGMPFIFPTHQGRAAEHLLALTQVKPGHFIPNNSHFDTTRANMEFAGATALDFPCPEASELASQEPFKGNMDLDKLKIFLEKNAKLTSFVMITVTNNSGGGQPVSMQNIRQVKKLCEEFQIPLIIDACRFAENAYFIKIREKGYSDRSLVEIAQEMFSYADAATMSLKKDGLVNIGGFFTCRNEIWANDFRNVLILQEGFPTYGGLAGRDLEGAAVGIREALEWDYQYYRHATIEYIMQKLVKSDIPVVTPGGGHAVFIDAGKLLPHIAPADLPGIALVNALYLEGGIRSVELGSLMFGRSNGHKMELARHELVRLAFPRRVYTQSHFDYLYEVIMEVYNKKNSLRGYRIVKQSPFLRHFSAWLEKLDDKSELQ